MAVYGAKELLFAQPIADALVSKPDFRAWFLAQTKFRGFSSDAKLLNEEMLVHRSRDTPTWWRSHYSHKCHCAGCSGKETDLLAIFETPNGLRFAIHVEVKHPTDEFKSGQAAAYPLRSECWKTSGRTPDKVLEHSESTTLLLCGRGSLERFSCDLPHFATVLTFEEISKNFPDIYKDILVSDD